MELITMMRRAAFVTLSMLGLSVGLAFAQTSAVGFTPPPGVTLQDEGSAQGRVRILDCVGAGIACTAASGTGTLTVSGGSAGVTNVTKTADQSFGTTFANVTDLSIAVAANTDYRIDGYLIINTVATTEETSFQWTCPASPTEATFVVTFTTATSTFAIHANACSTAINPLAGASDGTTRNIFPFRALFRNGANAGTLQLQVKSSATANGTTIHQGSWFRYH